MTKHAQPPAALSQLGWNQTLERAFEPYARGGLAPARVAAQHRGRYDLCTGGEDLSAETAGRLRHNAATPADLPAVGDWVAYRHETGAATIEAVLPRRTAFVRKVAGAQAVEQVLAANVDVVFALVSLAEELNPRRLERFLAAAWDSGADPVVVLTKSDLCAEVPGALADVEVVASGVPVHAISGVTGAGIDRLRASFEGDRTVALLGRSGVGKSTLANRLLGSERQETRAVRDDGRGRHTTTHRELLLLPDGGLVLDTPGLRELGLWEADDGLDAAFDDVAGFAARCRFSDCGHESEPGCAVRKALADGRLDPLRLESYRKLERELRHLAIRQDRRAAAERKREWRRLERSRRMPAEGRWMN